jgi:phosphoglucomutase
MKGYYRFLRNTAIIKKRCVTKGKDGALQIANILATFHKESPKEFEGVAAVVMEDYLTSKRTMIATREESVIDLPRSNVLKYHLANGS